jgi:phytoene synthase
MEHRGYDPFSTVIEAPQWRRQWVLWRAARRYGRTMRG